MDMQVSRIGANDVVIPIGRAATEDADICADVDHSSIGVETSVAAVLRQPLPSARQATSAEDAIAGNLALRAS